MFEKLKAFLRAHGVRAIFKKKRSAGIENRLQLPVAKEMRSYAIASLTHHITVPIQFDF